MRWYTTAGGTGCAPRRREPPGLRGRVVKERRRRPLYRDGVWWGSRVKGMWAWMGLYVSDTSFCLRLYSLCAVTSHPSHPVVELGVHHSQHIIHLGNQMARQKQERCRLPDGWLVHGISHNKEARAPYCSDMSRRSDLIDTQRFLGASYTRPMEKVPQLFR